jgi:hypothetical protein
MFCQPDGGGRAFVDVIVVVAGGVGVGVGVVPGAGAAVGRREPLIGPADNE